jgi:hypothetical protein
MPLDVVEAWTGPLDFQLKADGVVVNLTGLTVGLVLKDSVGAVVTVGGTLSILDAVNGKVRFTPAATDLVVSKSPYAARIKVTDAGGKDVFFPNAAPDPWTVFA